MSRKNQALFLLSFVVLAAAPARAAALIEGRIASAAGGARLTGKVVAAYDTAGFLKGVAQSDSAGMYQLTVSPGAYRLLAYDPDGAYATSFYGDADSFETTPVVQVADGAPLQADFALAAGGKVAGSVGAGSSAAGGAVVEAYNLSGTRRGFTTANAAGQYTLVRPAGDYKIFAYDPDDFYAGEFHSSARAFANAALVRVTPPGTTTVAFVLDRAARVSGTVVDADTGAALSSIVVYAYTSAGALVKTTTSGADGAFTFSLGPGQYRFVAGDPSHDYAPSFYSSGRSFEHATVVTLAAGQQLAGLTMAAERGAQIRGHVPAGLTVAAYNLDGTLHSSATANANGEYVLVVAPGDYKIAVFDPTGVYAPQFRSLASEFSTASVIAILAGQTLQGIDFAPPQAGRFTGTVRDAANGQPLAGKVVSAYDAANVAVAHVATAQDGTYAIALAPGQYRLLVYDETLQYATAYAGGAASYDATIPLTVSAGQTTAADFSMRRGVRLAGTVRNESGAAIDGIEIFALDAAGNRVSASTSSAGAFTIVLLPGTYRFLATDPRHRYFAELYAGGATITIGTASPSPIAFILNPVHRRRAVRR